MIQQILTGRTERFWELVQPHVELVLRVVCTAMRKHSDTEDVVQETILKAFTRLKQFRFESSFRSWLTRIAINEARQWYRSPLRSRFAGFEDHGIEEWQIADALSSPFETCEQRERVKLIHLALARLPEKYQSIIRLREFEQLSLAETARALSLTIPAVKTRHRRARLHMMRDLMTCSTRGTHASGLP